MLLGQIGRLGLLVLNVGDSHFNGFAFFLAEAMSTTESSRLLLIVHNHVTLRGNLALTLPILLIGRILFCADCGCAGRWKVTIIVIYVERVALILTVFITEEFLLTFFGRCILLTRQQQVIVQLIRVVFNIVTLILDLEFVVVKAGPSVEHVVTSPVLSVRHQQLNVARAFLLIHVV